MPKPTRLILLPLLFLLVIPRLQIEKVAYAANSNPGRSIVRVKAQSESGRQEDVELYKSSRALLIGVSDYTAGWQDLESVPKELDEVAQVIAAQGFHVEKYLNPDSRTLKALFEKFIGNYGYDPDARLLFFFSGHGYTRLDGEKGYLVPTDAPDPEKDEIGFLQKALAMDQILSWSRQMEIKHALFLFDSCFSGTVFKAKERIKVPPYLTMLANLQVRQYITAGNANETVPARSVFSPAFVDAIKYGLADLNKDGYISGTELGLYLQTEVPQHSHQTPQFGKIQDYRLSRGDFIFVLGVGKIGEDTENRPDTSGTQADRLQPKTEDKDELFWESIKDRDNPAVFEAYLQQFPKGTYAVLAKIRLDELKALADPKAPKPSPPTPPTPVAPPPTAKPAPSLTGTDGSYVAYATGVVYDKSTGLEWYVGPNKDTTWDEAKQWTDNLTAAGGRWRMPTRNELKSLHKKDAGSRNMTPLLTTTGWWVWSVETKGSSGAWGFHFGLNNLLWSDRKNFRDLRAFAVRSRSDDG